MTSATQPYRKAQATGTPIHKYLGNNLEVAHIPPGHIPLSTTQLYGHIQKPGRLRNEVSSWAMFSAKNQEFIIKSKRVENC